MKKRTLEPTKPMYEVVINIEFHYYRFRVWLATEELRRPYEEEIVFIKERLNAAYSAKYGNNPKWHEYMTNEILLDILKDIGSFEQCAAIEATSMITGIGMLYYPDWK